MTTPAGAGADHYLAHPYATVQLWRWATVRTDVTGTTTDQGDALRTNDDLSLLVYLDTVGSPTDRFPRVVASPLVGPAFLAGDVAYLALTCFTEVFRGNPPGQVVLRVTEVVAGQVGKPHHVAVPAGQGVLVTTTVPYEPIIADGPRSLRLELLGEDNPSLDCRVFVTRLAVTTYAPLGGGGTTRQTAGSSNPRGGLTVTGRVEPGQPQYVGPVDVRPTLVAAGLSGAPTVTVAPQGLTATQQVAAPTVVPDSRAGGALLVGSALAATGYTATSTVQARDGLTGAVTSSGTFLPSTAVTATLRVDCAMTVTGQASVVTRTGSSSLQGFASGVASLSPVTGLTAQLRADAASAAQGFTATSTATARDALTATVTAVASAAPRFTGTAPLAAAAALSATGSANVQVVTAAADAVSGIQGAVQAVIVTVGRALTEVLTRLEAEGIDATALIQPQPTDLTATVRAAQNAAGIVEGTADLEQTCVLIGVYQRNLQIGDQPPTSLTGQLLVDPAGLPSGTGYAEQQVRLVAAGVAGPATAGVAWRAHGTSALAVDTARTTVTVEGYSVAMRASAGSSTRDVYVTRIPQFVTLQGDSSLEVYQATSLVVPSGRAPLDTRATIRCRTDLDAYEAPTITRDGHVLATGSSLQVQGAADVYGTAQLAASASSSVHVSQARAIPLVQGDQQATFALRATATVAVATRLLQNLLVKYGTAHLLVQSTAQAQPAVTQPVSVAVQLRASAAVAVTGAARDTTVRALTVHAQATGTVTVAARAESNAQEYAGLAFLEQRVGLENVQSNVFGTFGAAAVQGGAELRLVPGQAGEDVAATVHQVALTGGATLTCVAQARVDVGFVVSSTLRCTDYQSIPVAAQEAHLEQSLSALRASGEQQGYAVGAGDLDLQVLAGVSAQLLPLLTSPAGTVLLAASARLQHEAPVSYAGADLVARATLDPSTRRGTAQVRARARLRATGGEGVLHGGSGVEVTVTPQGRVTPGGAFTSRAAPRATLTAVAFAQPAEHPPLHVRGFTGTADPQTPEGTA